MCEDWKSIIKPYRIFLSLVSVNKVKNAMIYKHLQTAIHINTLRMGSFKLFKRPFPGFLTILTL